MLTRFIYELISAEAMLGQVLSQLGAGLSGHGLEEWN